MEVSEVIEKVLAFLSEFDEAIDIAMMICMILINRKCGKLTTSAAKTSATVPSPTVTSETQQAKVLSVTTATEEAQKVAAKKKLRSEMLAALDVMFSDKSDDELTEAEQRQVDKVLAYMNGGS